MGQTKFLIDFGRANFADSLSIAYVCVGWFGGGSCVVSVWTSITLALLAIRGIPRAICDRPSTIAHVVNVLTFFSLHIDKNTED